MIISSRKCLAIRLKRFLPTLQEDTLQARILKALKVTYTVNLEELGGSDIDEREAVKSVKLASSPEEAVEWVKSAQSTSSARYYFMPDYEKTSFSKLYIYRLSEVERYQASYGYTMPEEPAQFYSQKEIPVKTAMVFAEK